MSQEIFKPEEMQMQAFHASIEYLKKAYNGAPLETTQIALNAFAAGFITGIIWRDKTLGLRSWNDGDTRELFRRADQASS